MGVSQATLFHPKPGSSPHPALLHFPSRLDSFITRLTVLPLSVKMQGILKFLEDEGRDLVCLFTDISQYQEQYLAHTG